jgi:malate synthase
MLDPRINCAQPGFDYPEGFLDFLLPLHSEFTPRQKRLAAARGEVLRAAHRGELPDHLPASQATSSEWRIDLPEWCQDQRNQMTGPADDAELVVKMLNSGAPGVMLDLEDSMANTWPNLTVGVANILDALRGALTYFDRKRAQTIAINESKTVIWVRPRGLHLSQAGVLDDKEELMSASLFDVAMIAYQIDFDSQKNPLSFYIPKSESAEEARWWRDLFQAVARAKGAPADYIKCMALVE